MSCKFKLIIKIDVSKGLSILDFLKGYKPLGYKNSGLSRHRPRAAEYLNSGLTCQPVSVMIEVFKVALAQWLLFYQWIQFIQQWRE